MGFHPFSDGLPYAPESKAKTASRSPAPRAPGAGATAAGHPRFSTAPSAHSIAPAPMRTARQLQSSQTPGAPLTLRAKSAPATQAKAPVSTLEPAAKPAARNETVAPGVVLRTRFFAYLLDSVIHAGFWLATNIAALLLFHFQIDLGIVKENTGQLTAFFLFSQWMFIALQEVMFGNSIGKAFFELEFQRNHRSLFLRSIVFMAGLLAFGLGLRYRPQDRLGGIRLRQGAQ